MEVVGVAIYPELSRKPTEKGDMVIIHALVVKKLYRDKGIATALQEWVHRAYLPRKTRTQPTDPEDTGVDPDLFYRKRGYSTDSENGWYMRRKASSSPSR